MWLQHGRDPYSRSHCGKETNQDGTREDKGGQRREDTDKSKGHGKLPRLCKFLSMIYPKLQLYGKAIKWIKRQEGLEVGRGTSKDIWRTQRENNELTSTGTT